MQEKDQLNSYRQKNSYSDSALNQQVHHAYQTNIKHLI